MEPDRDHADQPTPARDPRLEIPEILREPATPATREPKPSALASNVGEIGTALAIGIDFLVVVAAGGAAGWLIDRWQGWSPIGLFVGVGLGFLAGLGRLIHRLSKEDAKARARAAPRPPATARPGGAQPPKK